jgi:hypothetical protein
VGVWEWKEARPGNKQTDDNKGNACMHAVQPAAAGQSVGHTGLSASYSFRLPLLLLPNLL